MNPKSLSFRKLIEGENIILAPGVYDALTAKLAEQAEFKVLYVTGGGVSRGLIGRPDIGLVTMTEMVDQVRRIALTTTLPLFNDADTGYGNMLNISRAVREFEQAGSSGIHIEDQTFPKRCGHFSGKDVISAEEMIGKVKAAVDSRQDPNFIIIARTDARSVLGLSAALDRAAKYAEAGADVVFVESPESKEELCQIARVATVPSMANMVEGGKTPLCNASELEQMGFKIVIFPGSLQRCIIKSGREFLKHLKEHGTSQGAEEMMLKWEERNVVMGLEEYFNMIKKYS